MLQSVALQRVGHNLVTEQQQLVQAVSMGAETDGEVILIFLQREFQRMREVFLLALKKITAVLWRGPHNRI